MCNGCRYEVKHISGTGRRSPPRGGVDPSAQNQQLLADDDDEEDAALAGPTGGPAGLPGPGQSWVKIIFM